jgi:hypothetical protein
MRKKWLGIFRNNLYLMLTVWKSQIDDSATGLFTCTLMVQTHKSMWGCLRCCLSVLFFVWAGEQTRDLLVFVYFLISRLLGHSGSPTICFSNSNPSLGFEEQYKTNKSRHLLYVGLSNVLWNNQFLNITLLKTHTIFAIVMGLHMVTYKWLFKEAFKSQYVFWVYFSVWLLFWGRGWQSGS